MGEAVFSGSAVLSRSPAGRFVRGRSRKTESVLIYGLRSASGWLGCWDQIRRAAGRPVHFFLATGRRFPNAPAVSRYGSDCNRTAEQTSDADLIIVIGAQVFRYYPFVAGEYLPSGAELLQVTNDPWDAAAAVAGDSLLSDAKLALEAFIDAVPTVTSRTAPAALPINRNLPSVPNNPLTALEAFAALSELRPPNAILVNETASNFADLIQNWPIQKADTYYTFASGGLGWGSPAAVGVALAEKKMGTNHPVVAVIGDGAFQYSVQDVYTAVQLNSRSSSLCPATEIHP